MTSHTHRPLAVSSGLAVLAGVTAVQFVATGAGQRLGLAIVVVGIAGTALGLEGHHRGHGLAGGAATLGGGGVALAGMAWGVMLPRNLSPKLVFLLGAIGLLGLVLGLVAVKPGYERWFVSAGTGAMLLAVFFSGFVHGASIIALLVATAVTVVAWDLGEQAINMGEQLSRQARTWRVELAHGGVSLLVGGVGVTLALAINGIGISGLPLGGFVALVAAGVILAVLFYQYPHRPAARENADAAVPDENGSD